MNTLTKITVMTIGLAAAGAAGASRAAADVFAPQDSQEAYERAYVDSYRNRSRENPIPIVVESPDVPPETIWQDAPCTVRAEFIVGIDGKTSHVKIVSGVSLDFTGPVLDAVSDWRFEPALRDGKPVARKAAVTFLFLGIDDDDASSPGGLSTAKSDTRKNGMSAQITYGPIDESAAIVAKN